MAELAPRGPFDGLDLPVELGAARLAALALALGPLSAIAPFRGHAAAVEAALGAPLPSPGGVAALPGGRLIWSGIGQWLLQGPAPSLDGLAAATDQTDAWAGLALAGADARAVLARLVPLDLSPEALPQGAAARSQLRHLPLLILATADGFELLVPRSYARTAAAELATAMRAVAARAALGT